MVIEIMGVPYTVKETQGINADGEEFIMGQIDYIKQLILLDETMPPEMKQVTLLHEVLHGILMLMGQDAINDDEGFVTRLAAALYSTFKSELAPALTTQTEAAHD